jgi:putative endonuclease
VSSAGTVISGTFYVYIVVDPYGSFRVGVTNDLVLRLVEYRRVDGTNGSVELEHSRLVYYEVLSNLNAAVQREQQLRTWKRGRQKRLIGAVNPGWDDLLASRRGREA